MIQSESKIVLRKQKSLLVTAVSWFSDKKDFREENKKKKYNYSSWKRKEDAFFFNVSMFTKKIRLKDLRSGNYQKDNNYWWSFQW